MTRVIDVESTRRLAFAMLQDSIEVLSSPPPNPPPNRVRIVWRDRYLDRARDVLWWLSPSPAVWADLAGVDLEVLRERVRTQGLLVDPWGEVPPIARTELGGRRPVHDDPERNRQLEALLRGLGG